MERNARLAGESGDRPPPVADQVIARRDDAGERGSDGNAVNLRQDRIEGRALPVARDEDGNVILIKAWIAGLSTSLSRLSRQIGPPALEGFRG